MKRTIGQTLSAVEGSVSSIFTKEDVVELLRNIEEETQLSDEQRESIVSDIMQNIEYAEDNLIDKDSVRLDIDSSNYITIDRVDIDFDAIRHAVKDVIFNLD